MMSYATRESLSAPTTGGTPSGILLCNAGFVLIAWRGCHCGSILQPSGQVRGYFLTKLAAYIVSMNAACVWIFMARTARRYRLTLFAHARGYRAIPCPCFLTTRVREQCEPVTPGGARHK